ncbi:MAG: hypothetical protein ACRYG7_01875 [Janthinobacterium lividum]
MAAVAAATGATTGVAAAAVASATSPTHWLDTLEQQLQAGPDVRKTVGKWLASGVSEDKLKAAMQQPDFQQTFIRLAVADKGLYQQHVILDDYAAIPGVSSLPYTRNSFFLCRLLLVILESMIPTLTCLLPKPKPSRVTPN